MRLVPEWKLWLQPGNDLDRGVGVGLFQLGVSQHYLDYNFWCGHHVVVAPDAASKHLWTFSAREQHT